MTVHTDSTTASQSPPPLTSGEADLQRWGCGRWEGGEGGRGGVIPSHGVVNVSAVDSERTEDGVVRTLEGREGEEDERDEAGAKAEAGVPGDGDRWMERVGGRGRGSHSADGWHASERGELRRAAPRTRKRAE